MPTAFFLSKLKAGVNSRDYEKWVREVDYPTSKKLKTIKSYKVYRINGTFDGEKKYDYIEVIEITDLAKYRKELTESAEGKKIMSEWSGFIGEYHAVHGEAF